MNVIMAGKLFNALGADTAIAEVVEAWRTGAARVAVVADCGAFTIDDKGALNGVASNIWGADVADYFILVLDDSRLLLLPREHSALFLKTYIQVDGSGTADLEVQGLIMSACMELVADVSLKAVMQKATQCMQLALCAEAAGLMRFALDATVDYCRQREQFGRSLSDFQVLQHRMADMFIECELAWSLVLRAAMTGSGQDVTAFHAMKYRVSTAAKKVGQEALQLHGGMGLCDEVAVSHAFKRLTVIAQSFGNADQCLQRYVDGLA
jgi:alkylation response protein AidB-like acyl-CoA dehydrogenase